MLHSVCLMCKQWVNTGCKNFVRQQYQDSVLVRQGLKILLNVYNFHSYLFCVIFCVILAAFTMERKVDYVLSHSFSPSFMLLL